MKRLALLMLICAAAGCTNPAAPTSCLVADTTARHLTDPPGTRITAIGWYTIPCANADAWHRAHPFRWADSLDSAP